MQSPIGAATIHNIAAGRATAIDTAQPFNTIKLEAVAHDQPSAPESLVQYVGDATTRIAGTKLCGMGYPTTAIARAERDRGEGRLDRMAAGHQVGETSTNRAHGRRRPAGLTAGSLTTCAPVRANPPSWHQVRCEILRDQDMGLLIRTVQEDKLAQRLRRPPRVAIRIEL